VLELGRGRTSPAVVRLGPDVMADPPDLDAMIARLRGADQGRQVGEALLDQRLVAGIGNKWRAEALFLAATSPWCRLGELADADLRRILEAASTGMREGRGNPLVYRRSGLPCRRCATPIASRPQGETARIAYWCPACQAGTAPASA
jgi:endonuclease-8